MAPHSYVDLALVIAPVGERLGNDRVRQHRSSSRGASRIHNAVRNRRSAHLSRCRAMTLCKR